MAYDLSGLAAARATIDQMIIDQRAGVTKFAGGSATWVAKPTGVFNAVLTVGGSLQATTTNVVRSAITVLESYFALLAAGAGKSATTVGTVAASGSLPQPITGGATTVQQTKYDLSGIAAAQLTAAQMVADQASGTTDFAGGKSFQAIFTSGAASQAATMFDVIARFAALKARFDLLAQ